MKESTKETIVNQDPKNKQTSTDFSTISLTLTNIVS